MKYIIEGLSLNFPFEYLLLNKNIQKCRYISECQYFALLEKHDARYILLRDRIDASSDIVGVKISSYAQYLEFVFMG